MCGERIPKSRCRRKNKLQAPTSNIQTNCNNQAAGDTRQKYGGRKIFAFEFPIFLPPFFCLIPVTAPRFPSLAHSQRDCKCAESGRAVGRWFRWQRGSRRESAAIPPGSLG